MMDTGSAASAEPPPSAAERVYRYVRAEILARRVVGHDVLSEGQIAAAVGVSRTPVREALLKLESEGILRLLPKRGALVLPVTTEQMLDLIEARRVIEAWAIRKVVTDSRGVSGLVAALERHIGIMRSALVAGDGPGYVSADRDFHAEIVNAAGNSVLSETYRGLRDRQVRMGVVNLLDEGAAPDAARIKATLADHEHITSAIRERRLRAAEAATSEHLDSAERLLRSR
jgi:DNA-binding GntR family transcriptional regulator